MVANLHIFVGTHRGELDRKKKFQEVGGNSNKLNPS